MLNERFLLNERVLSNEHLRFNERLVLNECHSSRHVSLSAAMPCALLMLIGSHEHQHPRGEPPAAAAVQ
jgi:hypothetical protein